jgi:predicted NUDIX family phosphoesterase
MRTALRAPARLEPRWLPRAQAETDPTFKQWIPYVLLRNSRGEMAASPRQGAEARLHGLWSVGLGGHVNPVDAPATGVEPRSAWRDLLWTGLRRELAEEYPGAAAGTTRFLGLIHESRTAVGRVHLGVVFLHETAGDPGSPGDELTGLRWVPPRELSSDPWPLDRFELWSRLALRLFEASILELAAARPLS